jgi:hypothetical protein
VASREKVVLALREAMEARKLVVVLRRVKFADDHRGFVVGIGSRWMLLQETDDAGAFDGYVAVRIRDVDKLKPDRSFAVRAAPSLPHWPPAPPSATIDLNTTRGVLTGFRDASESGLIAIKKERRRYAQWIGVFDEVIGKYVYLHEVDPDGKWDDQPLGYKIGAITMVGTGGLYRDALARYVDWDAKPTASS